MANAIKRPPVVAVLGHVDHGKTTLLDTIRKADVASGEFGGITQHIGAYEITTKDDRRITFIDTPGHEAFQNLRARGVSIADVALLVVAADDSVQPQTKESIEVIKKADIPFIVVINKVDLPGVNVEKVVKDLTRQEVYLEGRGGETPMVEVSAKKGTNIDSLLELIALVSDLNDLTYTDEGPLVGGVIESKKDRRGIVLTVILRDGRLKVGDTVYIGASPVKIRAMFNDEGRVVRDVAPSTPVEILGSRGMISPGTVVSARPPAAAEGGNAVRGVPTTAADFFKEQVEKFNFIVRADSYGSLEVIREKFAQFEEIEIISGEVGDLTEADVEMASATSANILLFNVRMKGNLAKKVELENINVFEFNLIYELLEQVEDLIFALREKKEKEEKKVGEAKVQAKFLKENVQIAGLKIITGRIRMNDKAELHRGKKLLGETTIRSLYQKSDQVAEVKKGEECGAIFDPKLDFQQGDIVKLYVQ